MMSSSGDRSHRLNRHRFVRRCACINHDIWECDSNASLVSLNSSRHRPWYRDMLQRKLFTQKQKSICVNCIAYHRDHFTPPTVIRSSTRKDEQINTPLEGDCADVPLQPQSPTQGQADSDLLTATSTVDDLTDASDRYSSCTETELSSATNTLSKIISSIQWKELSTKTHSDLCSLSLLLGKLIQHQVYLDSSKSSLIYKDQTVFGQTSPQDWISNQNPLLVNFLSGCTGVDVQNESNIKKVNGFAHAIEQVQYARNLQSVTPFSFQRNLISYSLTGSKTVTMLTGCTEPAGGYTTVHKFLNSPSPVAKPEAPANHTIHVAFDNNQKVGHTSGKIREGSCVPVSICTALTYIEPQHVSSVQQNEEFTNDKWYDPITITPIIAQKISEQEQKHQTAFREYRTQYIDETLKLVLSEQERDDNTYDHIDITTIQHQSGFKTSVCALCTFVYSNYMTACPKCPAKPSSFQDDPYYRTPARHATTPPQVKIGEPCMVNPNSVKNTKQVLLHIKDLCQVPEERKWIVVWSDGVPYIFMHKLIESIYVCSMCQTEIDISKTSFEIHCLNCEHMNNDSDFHRLFDFIIPRPGPGHIEINMAKTLLSLLWKPFLCHFAVILGFRSSRAQDVVRTGIDHHRSRQILFTVLQALSRELVLPYIRYMKDTDSHNMSVLGYFQWYEANVTDQVYHFLFDTCFTYLLSFHLYNEATRKNNSQRMMAARVVFAPLFSARHHPKYRELHLRDMLVRAQCPDEILTDIEHTESFSVSGCPNKGQGADFIQEEKNKVVKSFLPPGMPTEHAWIRLD